MLQCTPAEIAQDTETLLAAASPLLAAGVKMDYGAPGENIFAIAEVVERYRCYGA